IYTWTSGAFYAGQWTEDERDGYGVYCSAKGKEQAGVWEMGEYLEEDENQEESESSEENEILVE
ncbi:MAG: hypothetical protein LUF30_05805, partial [Lachnospiraceae bacterium]|nr:hypothetical protein [Lachnospiraceae bacterium]